MPAAALALILGTAALWVGGEQLVLGASRLAERTRLPTILIGMVVAGFGTSAPELTVSLLAQARGEGALAVGNALGSNVANVLLVLPVAALAAPWVARGDVLRREVFGVLVATAAVVAVAADGRVSRAEAGSLVAAFLGVMAWQISGALASRSRAALEDEIEDLVGERARPTGAAREAARTVLGLAVVVASADRLVWGAGTMAARIGMSEAAIGLTVVAVGTSLPELVTSLIAARRGEPDLVLGNVLGSNIFNALLIVGAAGLARPLAMAPAARAIALTGVTSSALLLLAFLVPGYKLGRAQALAGLAAYAAFIATLAAWA